MISSGGIAGRQVVQNPLPPHAPVHTPHHWLGATSIGMARWGQAKGLPAPAQGVSEGQGQLAAEADAREIAAA